MDVVEHFRGKINAERERRLEIQRQVEQEKEQFSVVRQRTSDELQRYREQQLTCHRWAVQQALQALMNVQEHDEVHSMEVARDPVAHINQVPPNECTLAQNPISADGSEVTSTPDTTTWQPEPEPIASPKLAERVDDLSPSTPSVSVFTLSPSSVATARSPTSTPSRPHISPRLLSPSVSASPSSPATSHRPVRRHLPTHTQQALAQQKSVAFAEEASEPTSITQELPRQSLGASVDKVLECTEELPRPSLDTSVECMLARLAAIEEQVRNDVSLLDSDEEDGVDCEQQLEEEATAGYGHSLGRVGAGSAIPMPPRAVLPETTMENGPDINALSFTSPNGSGTSSTNSPAAKVSLPRSQAQSPACSTRQGLALCDLSGREEEPSQALPLAGVPASYALAPAWLLAWRQSKIPRSPVGASHVVSETSRSVCDISQATSGGSHVTPDVFYAAQEPSYKTTAAQDASHMTATSYPSKASRPVPEHTAPVRQQTPPRQPVLNPKDRQTPMSTHTIARSPSPRPQNPPTAWSPAAGGRRQAATPPRPSPMQFSSSPPRSARARGLAYARTQQAAARARERAPSPDAAAAHAMSGVLSPSQVAAAATQALAELAPSWSPSSSDGAPAFRGWSLDNGSVPSSSGSLAATVPTSRAINMSSRSAQPRRKAALPDAGRRSVSAPIKERASAGERQCLPTDRRPNTRRRSSSSFSKHEEKLRFSSPLSIDQPLQFSDIELKDPAKASRQAKSSISLLSSENGSVFPTSEEAVCQTVQAERDEGLLKHRAVIAKQALDQAKRHKAVLDEQKRREAFEKRDERIRLFKENLRLKEEHRRMLSQKATSPKKAVPSAASHHAAPKAASPHTVSPQISAGNTKERPGTAGHTPSHSRNGSQASRPSVRSGRGPAAHANKTHNSSQQRAPKRNVAYPADPHTSQSLRLTRTPSPSTGPPSSAATSSIGGSPHSTPRSLQTRHPSPGIRTRSPVPRTVSPQPTGLTVTSDRSCDSEASAVPRQDKTSPKTPEHYVARGTADLLCSPSPPQPIPQPIPQTSADHFKGGSLVRSSVAVELNEWQHGARDADVGAQKPQDCKGSQLQHTGSVTPSSPKAISAWQEFVPEFVDLGTILGNEGQCADAIQPSPAALETTFNTQHGRLGA
uniref:Uncharacterized protein n=1 Tax=Eutreptiella gymnastica TaxID=73025 RepID=A0A7S4FMQ1_9EUGL